MPVSNSSVLGSRSTNFGAGRWIGQRSASLAIGAPPSTGSPSTLRIRPSAGLPTGTVIGPPVSSAPMPRTTPSVDDIATARTWLRPMCCCNLGRQVDVALEDLERVVELRELLRSNSTSMTGPMTWTTLPVFAMIGSGLLLTVDR